MWVRNTFACTCRRTGQHVQWVSRLGACSKHSKARDANTAACPPHADIQFEEKKVRKSITDAAKRSDITTCKVRCVQLSPAEPAQL